jgi:hypothetical protein
MLTMLLQEAVGKKAKKKAVGTGAGVAGAGLSYAQVFFFPFLLRFPALLAFFVAVSYGFEICRFAVFLYTHTAGNGSGMHTDRANRIVYLWSYILTNKISSMGLLVVLKAA